MIRTFDQRRSMRKTALGIVLVLGTAIVSAMAPQAIASRRVAAAPPPPVAVTYHLQAQFVTGPIAGNTLAGQVSGMLDSTGLLTATLTATSGATATVMGTITGTVPSAPVHLTMAGKAGTMTLTGALTWKAGPYGGTIQQTELPDVGTWLLMPETTPLSIDFGGKSGKGSRHRVALTGTLALSATPDGWADGTFTSLTTDTVPVAYGRIVNGNLTVTIHMPGRGDVFAVGSSRPFLSLTKWTGTFIGPAHGDVGTWLAEG
jgi:hypothetical protein